MKFYVWMNLIVYGGGMVSQIQAIVNEETRERERRDNVIGLILSLFALSYSITLLLTM